MEVVGIRFKNNCKLYYFSPNGLKLNVGDKAVVETPNGNTIATVVSPVTDIDEAQLVAPLTNVVRVATDNDIKTMEKLESKRNDVMKVTKELVDKYSLDMKLVDCEFTLDGQKIVISYVCEDRVDFRELVKDLASKLKSRIELKQIGIRDQAKAIGGIGCCGQVCCCSRYLNNFDKVSIKMAKTQDLSLNPTKISGVCGRLMCCLSYENEVYAESQKVMPKVNSKVKTPDGMGTVVYNNLLKLICDVKLDSDDAIIKKYPLKDISFDGYSYVQEQEDTTNYVMESDEKTHSPYSYMPRKNDSIDTEVVETVKENNENQTNKVEENKNTQRKDKKRKFKKFFKKDASRK